MTQTTKHSRVFLGGFALFTALAALTISLPCPAFANSVIDIYNIVRRQMMKNEEYQKYSDIMRSGSENIEKLAKKYSCSSNPDFDEKCKDWALDDSEEHILKPQSQLEKIHEILGPSLPLGDKSIAYQYIRCLEGTKHKGIPTRERYEVAACKNIPNWDYNPIMIKDYADSRLLEYLFAPEMRYFLVDEGGTHQEIHSRASTGPEIGKQSSADIIRFAREKMTLNLCSSSTANESQRNIRSELRNVLAQAYGTAVAVRRSGELFDEAAYPYMKELLKEPDLKLDTIRKSLHLWIAADAGIIWHLGQINAVQGLITELRALNGIGGIRTFGGEMYSFGVVKTQKDICR